MTKKAAIAAILLLSISIVLSAEAQKSPYWIDINLGLKEQYEESLDFDFMGGFSYQAETPYFLSTHISLLGLTDNAFAAYDLQFGVALVRGPIRLCPAAGIGYAKVGVYASNYKDDIFWHGDINHTGTVTLPLSCNLQCAFSKHFGIQATFTYIINHIRNFYGLYGGLVFGRLR